MKKIILVYTSMTGNTEIMAEEIASTIEKKGITVTMKHALDTEPRELLAYDGILIGSYTYENGSIPDEFMLFYEEMEELDLTGKVAAVFGSGDRYYDEFAKAVNHFIDRLNELGAHVVLDGLKVELTPEQNDIERCIHFAESFVEIFSKKVK